MYYCFNTDGDLVDAFRDEQDAASYCRDHAGCVYTDRDDATEAQKQQIDEDWALRTFNH